MPKHDTDGADLYNLLFSPNTTYTTTSVAPHKSPKPKTKDRDRAVDAEGALATPSKHHKHHKSKHKSSSSKETNGDSDASRSKSKKKHKKKKSKSKVDSPSSSSDNESGEAYSMDAVTASLSNLAQSHRAQLAATALVSGIVVGGTILGYQSSKRKVRTQLLKDSISNPDDPEDGDPMERSVDVSKLSHWLAHSINSLPGTRDGPPEYSSAAAVQPRQITDAESVALAQKAQTLAAQKKPIPEALILEQLSRTQSFLGSAGLRIVRSSFVVIVGLGGVGSWCTTMLVRSGIGRVRLIDFDQVTLSSLNRHAVATLEDVGTPKVLAMKKRLEAVAPWVEIETYVEMWTEKDAARLLDGEPDWVIDAIDNIDTKVDLLAYCHNRDIPVISSMGAGCKSDPTRICVGDISETTEDPLSKATRRMLRQRGIATGIPVVYSTEKPGPGKAQLLPVPDNEHEKGDVRELGVLENFRVRILPVLGTMPATFGLAAANHVLCKLAAYPLDYLPGNTRFRPQFYGQVINLLLAVESRIRNNVPGLKVPVSEADAGYVMEEVFASRSVVSGLTNRLQLVRWYPLLGSRYEDGSSGADALANGAKVSEKEKEQRAKKRMEKLGVGVDGAIFMKLTDLVVMTREEVKVHEKRVLIGGEAPGVVWGQDVQELVEKKWREERSFSQWRD
ncbi:tRNA threonylcarbamoyladenosine dehydratase [Drechslerella dactyloides]|uniref:tRNA threonylcarbamoyladenosine dehydratase n=1 Tax=Drechslerella dactyloides TaxID=74499 RepID=A0AAD6NGM7_DREDA|nr:tRNA threonylcarbamoyladenosine dehydratase [Drechslerella dactyloides]